MRRKRRGRPVCLPRPHICVAPGPHTQVCPYAVGHYFFKHQKSAPLLFWSHIAMGNGILSRQRGQLRKIILTPLVLLAFTTLASRADVARWEYDRHVVFDNSLTD